MNRTDEKEDYPSGYCDITLEELLVNIEAREKGISSLYLQQHLARCHHCIRRLIVVRDLLAEFNEPSPSPSLLTKIEHPVTIAGVI